MLHLALRMAAHRITALLAVACAVLGGAALLTTTGVLAESGLRSQLPPGRLGGADVVVAADQEFHPSGDLPIALPERATVPARLVDRLAALPGVTAAVGDIGFPAALLDGRGRPVPVAQDPVTAGHGWSSTRLLVSARVEDGRRPVRRGSPWTRRPPTRRASRWATGSGSWPTAAPPWPTGSPRWSTPRARAAASGSRTGRPPRWPGAAPGAKARARGPST